MILLDDTGREIRRPLRSEFASDVEFVRAFHAYKTDIANTANRAFDEAFRKEMNRFKKKGQR